MKWVRARDGAIFGVAKGMARTLDVPVGVLRLLWLVSLLFLGSGLGLYIILALSLPREDKIDQALEPWILGVCTNVAKRTDIEIGLVRFLAIALAFLSLGATLLGYFALYFLLAEPQQDQTSPNQNQSSPSNPSTPPRIL